MAAANSQWICEFAAEPRFRTLIANSRDSEIRSSVANSRPGANFQTIREFATGREIADPLRIPERARIRGRRREYAAARIRGADPRIRAGSANLQRIREFARARIYK